MKKFIVFDTETTGLPKNYKASVKDVNNWPRIIQLAWAVYDEEGKELKTRCDLIKPDGWVIPKERFWIENGYSTEGNMEKGVDLQPLIEEMLVDLNDCDLLISHNMIFDSKVLGAEMYRKGMDTGKKIEKFCTKVSLTAYCQLPHANGRGGYKWPKLIEAHRKLFGTGFEGAHDALADVRACGRVFFEAKKKGIINV